MAFRYRALHHESQLRDEVLYLHSLWNQGTPPSSSANRNPNSALIHLRPRSSLSLSTDRNRRRRKRNAVVSKEWPCDPTPDQMSASASTASTCWPVPPPKPAPPSPSAEDLVKAAAFRLQMSGVEACKRFFYKKNREVDCDESSESSEEDVEEVEEGAFKLFLEIFTKDHELRKYYEGNLEKGEFVCLVCEGSGAKKGRVYGDCAGLVQHCNSLAKIGWRGAHRGLAKAVCRVVGWNFGRLPMLVLDLEETLGQCLARDASQ